MKFTVGSKVFWESQARGGYIRKEGKVVAVVPAGEILHKHPFVKKTDTKTGVLENYKIMFDWPVLPRNHESYLVEVPGGKTIKAKLKLYWPRTSVLKEAV